MENEKTASINKEETKKEQPGNYEYKMDDLAKQIRRYTKANKKTQKEFSVKAGITLGNMNRILSSAAKDDPLPTIPTLIKIANAEDISLQYLLYDCLPDDRKTIPDYFLSHNIDHDCLTVLLQYIAAPDTIQAAIKAILSAV